MHIENLNILNFKNIISSNLEFSDRINCFVGDNASGKTNIIDAVYFLSICKSSLAMNDRQCVKHGEEFFMLEADYMVSSRGHERIICAYKNNSGKQLKRNDKEYEKLSDHIGLFPVVLVSPADTMLIHESGEERRKYLNAFISQIDREYLSKLIKYNHILAQRNKLLKESSSSSFRSLIEVLDMQLLDCAEYIHRRRKEILEILSPIASKYYTVISDSEKVIEIKYKSDLNDGDYLKLLHSLLDRDITLGYTSAGIHRDDMVMSIDDYPLRKFGSQGEQKSVLISLKLAQFDIISEKIGYKPILLLDDIFDKLDMKRVENIVYIVSEPSFGQILLTDSNKVRVDRMVSSITQSFSIFDVASGEITKM